MNKKKWNIAILIFITMLSIPFALKVYFGMKLEQQQDTRKENFNKSLRFDLQLDDKQYYYKDIDDNISGYINGKDQNLKYSSYFLSSDSEYVITKINDKRARLYCNIPIDKASKDYIKTFGINNDIWVYPFNDSKIVLISIKGNNKQKSNYCILDLNNKSVNWTMSDKFDDAYYNSSTNTVIYTRNIQPSDSIWGNMKYEDFEVNMYGETDENHY